jgi:hypothetical protein
MYHINTYIEFNNNMIFLDNKRTYQMIEELELIKFRFFFYDSFSFSFTF